MSIKATVNKSLNRGKRIDADALFQIIKDYDYISFDIFDTLVKRNVENPVDIFSIIELQEGKEFKSMRIEAEVRARRELEKKEIIIQDIYSYFPKDDRQRLLKLELDTELKAIVPNLPIMDVYNRCIQMGKIVYITSDMYWPENNVIQLLKQNGVYGYKKLYLSSKEQKVKSDGSLFHLLLEQEGIKPNQLVHIGDSKHGDYNEPRKMGIKAVHIPRFFNNIEFRGNGKNSKIQMNYLNNLINNTFRYTNDPYYGFGYSQFGKLLYGYVNWIHQQVKMRGIKKLFFFARDGYIMKRAYEVMIDDSEIETYYLEVSRRSLRGPILWLDSKFETIINMISNAKLITLTNIFDGICLDITNYEEVIRKHHLDFDSIFDRRTIYQNKRLKALIDELRPDIISNSKKEYELLIEYLDQNNVSGQFGVVDIGYSGSMQRYLHQVLTQLQIEHKITGFYLAVADFYKKNIFSGIELDLNGYLFDFMHDEKAEDIRSSFVGLFETLFLEQSGSVKKYARVQGEIIAERGPYEYWIDGKFTDDYLKIMRLQKGAIDFVSMATNERILKCFDYHPMDLFYGIYKVGTDPSMEDTKIFGDISFYDEGMVEKLAAPKRMGRYIVHPGELKTDFLSCRWKNGFMKRLFKIKLPYQKIYNILRQLR